MRKLKISLVSGGLVFLNYQIVWAQELFEEAPSIMEVVSNVVRFIFLIIAGIGVIGFVIGGLMYLVSIGNQEKMEQAKRHLNYAIIGLAIAIGSFALVMLINSLFGGQAGI
ncbi:MAG: hypothetical protein GF347_04625 [Candidatus Moranbacteria bacterium]|nr:hypothetical protein [Candidatus Moranbacteria bacterium]